MTVHYLCRVQLVTNRALSVISFLILFRRCILSKCRRIFICLHTLLSFFSLPFNFHSFWFGCFIPIFFTWLHRTKRFFVSIVVFFFLLYICSVYLIADTHFVLCTFFLLFYFNLRCVSHQLLLNVISRIFLYLNNICRNLNIHSINWIYNFDDYSVHNFNVFSFSFFVTRFWHLRITVLYAHYTRLDGHNSVMLCYCSYCLLFLYHLISLIGILMNGNNIQKR